MGSGVTRVAAPLTSPLEQLPCIAFRLVGKTPRGAVDDAGIASFEVCVDGDWITVSGEAIVELPPARPRRIRRYSEELEAFLDERGLWCPTGVRLAESVLRPGDVVEVIGAPVRQPVDGGGYREASLRLAKLVGTSEQPLLVRRPQGRDDATRSPLPEAQ